MRDTSTLGLMLAMTAWALVKPLLSGWWPPTLIGGGVAAVSALLFSYGLAHIPDASPRLVATLTTVLLLVATAGAVVFLFPRVDSAVQTVVLAAAPFVLFRLVVPTVDLFTPSFTVSLLAGLSGMVVFAAAAPLLAHSYANLSVWACVGIAAALGYVEGVVAGGLLRLSLRTGSTT